MMKRVSLGVARLEIGCGRISVWIQSYTADDSIRKVFEKRKLTTYSYLINGCVPGPCHRVYIWTAELQ